MQSWVISEGFQEEVRSERASRGAWEFTRGTEVERNSKR